MLRLSATPLSSRLGGWALVESPSQRTEATGQQWSFVIAATATLVAISAVIFDVRLSSEVSLPVVIPSPAEAETAQRAVTHVAPPPAIASSPEAAGHADSDAAALTSTATERIATPVSTSPVEREAASATSAASESSLAAATDAEASGSAGTATGSAEAVALDDPATRIREYLGLGAGAQLPVSFSYEVEAGDTATSIAERFGLQEATVLFNNFDIYDSNLLTVGHKLTLPAVDGLVYTVQPGDSLDFLVENYQASLEATLGYQANGISSPDQIFVGQKLLLVHGSASVASATPTEAASGGQPAQVWTVPAFVLYLRYDKISDYFGTPRGNAVGYHTGVDYIAPVGELVGAAAAGRISVATWDPSYGNWVEIDHGGGYRSRYAHLDIINVREGQWVDAGSYIGTVGNTGNSSGAHLHFEIIIDGQAVNPLAWLN